MACYPTSQYTETTGFTSFTRKCESHSLIFVRTFSISVVLTLAEIDLQKMPDIYKIQ